MLFYLTPTEQSPLVYHNTYLIFCVVNCAGSRMQVKHKCLPFTMGIMHYSMTSCSYRLCRLNTIIFNKMLEKRQCAVGISELYKRSIVLSSLTELYYPVFAPALRKAFVHLRLCNKWNECVSYHHIKSPCLSLQHTLPRAASSATILQKREKNSFFFSLCHHHHCSRCHADASAEYETNIWQCYPLIVSSNRENHQALWTYGTGHVTKGTTGK